MLSTSTETKAKTGLVQQDPRKSPNDQTDPCGPVGLTEEERSDNRYLGKERNILTNDTHHNTDVSASTDGSGKIYGEGSCQHIDCCSTDYLVSLQVDRSKRVEKAEDCTSGNTDKQSYGECIDPQGCLTHLDRNGTRKVSNQHQAFQPKVGDTTSFAVQTPKGGHQHGNRIGDCIRKNTYQGIPHITCPPSLVLLPQVPLGD